MHAIVVHEDHVEPVCMVLRGEVKAHDISCVHIYDGKLSKDWVIIEFRTNMSYDVKVALAATAFAFQSKEPDIGNALLEMGIAQVKEDPKHAHKH